MLTEKERTVIRTLLQDEITISQDFNSDDIVKAYLNTLKTIESKLGSAEMILTV